MVTLSAVPRDAPRVESSTACTRERMLVIELGAGVVTPGAGGGGGGTEISIERRSEPLTALRLICDGSTPYSNAGEAWRITSRCAL